MAKPRALISLCLLGASCRYDGRGNPCAGMDALAERFELIPVCPEQLGGLPTPRTCAECRGDRVIARDGRDVTDAFRRGAEETCALARRFGAKRAILKARSPSCGVHAIYDGSFTGALVPGMGVTARALQKAGLTLYDEGEWRDMITDAEGDKP